MTFVARDDPPSSASLAVERARKSIWQLQALGFVAYLDPEGALLIADATGNRRDVSWRLPIAEVFDRIVAGLADDPGLLDVMSNNLKRRVREEETNLARRTL